MTQTGDPFDVEALLAEARAETGLSDFGADLLVMGIFGHSRLRELVLGGASNTLLASMTVPVLIAH